MRFLSFVMISLLFLSSLGCVHLNESQLRHASVKIGTPTIGTCSGEFVRTSKGKIVILTASHCRNLGGQFGRFQVEQEDGTVSMQSFIAEDPVSDLMVISAPIDRKQSKVLDLASKSTKPHDKVRTFSHGKGMITYGAEGEALDIQKLEIPASDGVCFALPKYAYGRVPAPPFGFVPVCVLKADFLITTAKVIPGSSGGMLVDSNGDLVGVISATDGYFSFIVPLEVVRSFLSGI